MGSGGGVKETRKGISLAHDKGHGSIGIKGAVAVLPFCKGLKKGRNLIKRVDDQLVIDIADRDSV